MLGTEQADGREQERTQIAALVCLDTILQKDHARSDDDWLTREYLRVSRNFNG